MLTVERGSLLRWYESNKKEKIEEQHANSSTPGKSGLLA